MDYRALDQRLSNFGFRLQYNRLYKPEYLPARVKYNQFFFVGALALGVGLAARQVSSQSSCC